MLGMESEGMTGKKVSNYVPDTTDILGNVYRSGSSVNMLY